MKFPFPLSLFAILLIFLPFSINLAQAQNSSPEKEKHEKMKAERAKLWNSLSNEEKAKMRATIRDAWSDPEVISARDSINSAVKKYQDALRNKIASQDPETAKLIEKLNANGGSSLLTAVKGHPDSGQSPHKRGGSSRSIEHILYPPHVLAGMTEDQEILFRKTGAIVLEKPDVAKYIKPIENLKSEEFALGRKKMDAFTNLRRAYFDAILKLEPSLKEPLSKSKSGGKGKGPRKRH